MKKIRSLPALLIALLITVSFSSMAQDKKEVVKEEKVVRHDPPKGRMGAIPGLTEDQKKKMKEIHLKAEKEIRPLKNLAAEKKAHLKTLGSMDKPDQAEINRTIDEMMSLKADMMKKESAAKQEIRKLLNDEQRMAFDRKSEHHADMRPHPPMKPMHPKPMEE